jgi:hypothetical protein
VEVIGRIFKMHFLFKAAIPLAPGFSPVFDRRTRTSRFNGFPTMPEAAEAADKTVRHKVTGLKPGANERSAG